MKIAVGFDHGGFALRELIIETLKRAGYEIVDCGAKAFDPNDDYPDFALAVATAIGEGQAERGILVCGSGVGASVAASKVIGIRAAVCHDTYSAHQGVEHDDMNVLCLGARIIGSELAKEIVLAFVNAKFNGSEKYQRRLEKIRQIEKSNSGEKIDN